MLYYAVFINVAHKGGLLTRRHSIVSTLYKYIPSTSRVQLADAFSWFIYLSVITYQASC